MTQLIAQLGSSLLTNVLGVSAGAAGTAGLSTGIALLGTAAAGAAAYQTSQYNAMVLERKALLEQKNAELVRRQGQQAARDADIEAAAVLGEVLAQQGASGFMVNSLSFRNRRTAIRKTARVNRQRLVEDAEVQATSAMERARTAKAEARLQRKRGLFSIFTTALGFQDDLISGANLASDLTIRRLNRKTVGV